MQKYHRAKFEITPRGKKSKYYTCSICGFRCWAFVAKDAHGQHKAHLTQRTPDAAKPPLTEEALQILEQCFPHVRDQ